MLIGLTGIAGSGKDTVAMFIQQNYDIKTLRTLAFAEPVKKACKDLFLLSDDQLHSQEHKETLDPRWGKSPRELFQWLGTDVLRKFDDDFFIKHVDHQIKNNTDTHKHTVVTDLRFVNEAKYIKSQGGIVVKIVRPNAETTKHKHISENGFDEAFIDITIMNDGTLDQLKDKVLAFCGAVVTT